jgi:hypothetical protein
VVSGSGNLKAACAIAAAIVSLVGPAAAQASDPLQRGANTERLFVEFRKVGPHRAFAVGPGDTATWRAGENTPEVAVATVLKNCAAAAKAECKLSFVNNYAVDGEAWQSRVPKRAAGVPDIGRLRPQPYWWMRGPQLAAGLLVWSHGYSLQKRLEGTAPPTWTGRFADLGYDLYRFDRELIAEWSSDADDLASAVREARKLGYRRVILAGQSAGAWVSLAAFHRDAGADAVISISAAHHGLAKDMANPDQVRREWQYVVDGFKTGPRVVLVNFAGDDYDIGGRMDVARGAFARNHVEAEVIDGPAGFTGHTAGDGGTFARKFGACIEAFVEHGKRAQPCTTDRGD